MPPQAGSRVTPSGLVCLAADKPGGWSLPEPILIRRAGPTTDQLVPTATSEPVRGQAAPGERNPQDRVRVFRPGGATRLWIAEMSRRARSDCCRQRVFTSSMSRCGVLPNGLFQGQTFHCGPAADDLPQRSGSELVSERSRVSAVTEADLGQAAGAVWWRILSRT